MIFEVDLISQKDKLLFREKEGERQLFCLIRKKWLKTTPEELVRQLFIIHLIDQLNFNKNRINVEKSLHVNGILKRFDVLVYNEAMEPVVLIECKAPHIPLKQHVFDQVSNYNQVIKASYLIITNGNQIACAYIDRINNTFKYLESLEKIA